MGNASGCKPPSFFRSGGLPIVNAQSSQVHQIRLGVWFWTTMTTHMAEDACVRVVSRLWDGCNGLVLPLRDTPALASCCGRTTSVVLLGFKNRQL